MSQTRLFMPRCAFLALMLCTSSVYAADTLDDAMASQAPVPMKPTSALSSTSETVSTDDRMPMERNMGSAHDKMTQDKMMHNKMMRNKAMPKKPMSHKTTHQNMMHDMRMSDKMMHDMPMSEKMSDKP